MTYDFLRVYVVTSKRKAAFYGICISTKEPAVNSTDDYDEETDRYRNDWLIVDKMQFVPCDFLSDEACRAKYTIVNNSDMKLGDTLIRQRCEKAVENFNEEIFRHCAPADDTGTEAVDNSPLRFYYESNVKKLLKKIERRPLHFKDYRFEYYVLPEDIYIDFWSFDDEKTYFPELQIIGPMLIIDQINGKITFDISTRKAFLGYADEILLRERMKVPQKFEILTNITNEMCVKIEDTYKIFMDVWLRESEVFKRLQEAEKRERERIAGN